VAMPLLRQLVTCLSQWRPEFNLKLVHVEFEISKVVLGQVFLKASLSAFFHKCSLLIFINQLCYIVFRINSIVK
jgi:hypothetical protein